MNNNHIYHPIEIHNFVEKGSVDDVGLIIYTSGGIDSIIEIIEYMRKTKLRISHIDWSEEVDGKNILFMVIREGKNRVDELIDELKGFNDVIDIKLSPEFGNRIYCPYFFPITISQQRAVLFEWHSIRSFIRNFYKMFMPEMVNSYLFHVGKAFGYALHDFYNNMVPEKRDLNNLIEFIRIMGILTGGFYLDHYEFDGDTIKIHIFENMECIVYRELEGSMGSNFLRGVLEAMFERESLGKIVVKEDDCISRGSDRCLFSVTMIR